jgi:heme-degrading monooxygenase HmoA
MVARIWHGYTSMKNADVYEKFLKTEFLPAIEKKNIPGYRKFQLLRKDDKVEVTFITIMWFDSLAQIKAFAGEDYEKAVVHPTAQALLKRYDLRSQHFELKHELNYDPFIAD